MNTFTKMQPKQQQQQTIATTKKSKKLDDRRNMTRKNAWINAINCNCNAINQMLNRHVIKLCMYARDKKGKNVVHTIANDAHSKWMQCHAMPYHAMPFKALSIMDALCICGCAWVCILNARCLFSFTFSNSFVLHVDFFLLLFRANKTSYRQTNKQTKEMRTATTTSVEKTVTAFDLIFLP